MSVNEIFYGTKYGEVGIAVAPAEGGELANAGTMCHLSTIKVFTDKTALSTTAKVDENGNLIASSTKDCAKQVNVEIPKDNTLGIELKSDGSIDTLRSNLTANTVEIDDNPTNTYGLASKIYLYKTILNHSNDPDAHSDIFNRIVADFTNLYEKHGEFKVNSISDTYGNVLYANGKYVSRGDDEHPKYVVVSSDRRSDYDDLVRRVEELETLVNQLQSK